MRFKTGDKVKVREDISDFRTGIEDVESLAGTELTITGTNGVREYRVEENLYGWLDEWIDGYTGKEITRKLGTTWIRKGANQ